MMAAFLKNKFTKTMATALVASAMFVMPNSSFAFQASDPPVSVDESVGFCAATRYFEPSFQTLQVGLSSSGFGDFRAAGGAVWARGVLDTSTYDAITEEFIADCFDGFDFDRDVDASQIRNLTQNGADGTYATDTFAGFSFDVFYPGDGTSADETVSYMFSVTGTAPVVNTPPVIDSIVVADDPNVANLRTVTVTASDADSDTLLYRWTPSVVNPPTEYSVFSSGNQLFVQVLPLPINAPDFVVNYTVTVTDGFDEVSRMGSVTYVSEKDTTPPDAPSADTVQATRLSDTVMRVSGTTEPNGRVAVTYDGTTYDIPAGETGAFSIDVANLEEGRGDIRVVFRDQFENAAEPYFIPVTFGPTVDETQAEVAGFMQSRAAQTIASQPDLIGMLSGTATGAFNVQATQGQGAFDMATPGNRNVWARVQGSWSETDTSETSYLFGVAGAHTQIGSDAIAGVMLQFDQTKQSQGDASTEGTGYLVGPYVVAKLPDQPLYFEGRALWGKTDNEVNVDGDTPENFETTRSLISAKVAGNVAMGDLTLTPHLSFTQLNDTQEAFTDSSDNDVPEQAITTTDATLGLDASQTLMLEGGALTLTGGVAAIWSATEGTGFAESVVPAFEGERARIHLGARYVLDNGMTLTAGTSFDGLGSDGYESTSVNLGLQMQF